MIWNIEKYLNSETHIIKATFKKYVKIVVLYRFRSRHAATEDEVNWSKTGKNDSES